MDILTQLKYPFELTQIHWRVGATNGDKTRGIALAYLDARDVMQRLDMVMGTSWQCRYSHSSPSGTICEIGLKLDGEWIWRSDGAGDTDYEATKGGLSDAFKRAAVRWGVGRYLYHLDAPWVPISSRGRSYVIDEDAAGSALNMPKWAIPDPPLHRLYALWEATGDAGDYVRSIKEGLDTGDLAHAARAWDALGDDTKRALSLPPSKGGVFTTAELKMIKSDEFARALRGEAA